MTTTEIDAVDDQKILRYPRGDLINIDVDLTTVEGGAASSAGYTASYVVRGLSSGKRPTATVTLSATSFNFKILPDDCELMDPETSVAVKLSKTGERSTVWRRKIVLTDAV